ncbi:S41 family peptidase [Inconstantimicrobium mannanitabidum]|uniref:Uncharacterized protein n=1 Tax=Inconstantimicrobium mannanitabidum TaxID=1604901 RepID=A0ACB5RHZ2_9CLOT|nr:S41 family peptidase [Clostridium sp. TW13]GKX68704.1 hypothetical protein rsdtw13_39620 [Clostridium sp. TW13]
MKYIKNLIFSLFCILVFCMSSLIINLVYKYSIYTNHCNMVDTMPYYDDLIFLKNVLPKKHPDLFFKISQESYYGKINNLFDNQNKYTVDKMRLEIMKLIASIGDGHTETYVKTNRYFPISFYWFDNNSLRITGCIKKYKRLLGYRVIKINNVPLSSIVNTLNSICPNESSAWQKHKLLINLENYELLKVLNIIPSGYLDLELEDLSGKKLNAKIFPFTQEKFQESTFIDLQRTKQTIPQRPVNSNENYWYTTDTASKIFYFKYHSCLDRNTALIIGEDTSSYDANLNSFFDKLVKDFDNSSAEKFIIDVRGNLGGNPKLIKFLIKKLSIDSKFNNFQKSKNRIFVFTDNSTFSAGAFAALNFKQSFSNVKIIGEPTGGVQKVFANPRTKLLSCSNLFLTYSTKVYSDGSSERTSINPDINPQTSLRDEFFRVDSDYETVKMLKIR